MVNTRRIAQSPRIGADDHAPSSPMSAKQLRQIRKLTIDGESALGGSGTLKRRTPAGHSAPNTDDPSPALVDTHEASPARVGTNEASSAEALGKRPPHEDDGASARARRQSLLKLRARMMRYVAENPIQSPRRKRTAPGKARVRSPPRYPPAMPRWNLPPRREHHWFLPSEDHSRENTPIFDAETPTGPVPNKLPSRTPSPFNGSVAARDTEEPSQPPGRPQAAPAEPFKTPASPQADPAEPSEPHTVPPAAHGEFSADVAIGSMERTQLVRFDQPTADTVHKEAETMSFASQTIPSVAGQSQAGRPAIKSKVRRKSGLTKAQRELKRLGIPPEQSTSSSLPLGAVPEASDLSAAHPATRHTTRQAGAAPRSQLSLMDQENPAVIRALKKLEIAANTSLIGVGTDAALPVEGDRRSMRRLRNKGPGAIRKQRAAQTARTIQHENKVSVQRFSADRWSAQHDHLLSIPASAAQEYVIVRVLAGDARNAIMRDVRKETFAQKQRRAQHELAVMQAWDIAPESEAARLGNLFKTGEGERLSHKRSAMTNEGGIADSEQISMSLAQQPNSAIDVEEVASRCSSNSTQGDYFTASDAATANEASEVPSNVKTLSRGKKRRAETSPDDTTSVDEASTGQSTSAMGETVLAAAGASSRRVSGAKRARLAQCSDSEGGSVGFANGKFPSESKSTSDHDTPQDQELSEGAAERALSGKSTTRILSPDGQGTVPLDGWKGKQRAAGEVPVSHSRG